MGWRRQLVCTCVGKKQSLNIPGILPGFGYLVYNDAGGWIMLIFGSLFSSP